MNENREIQRLSQKVEELEKRIRLLEASQQPIKVAGVHFTTGGVDEYGITRHPAWEHQL